MHEAMTFKRDWAAGLPLAIDISERWYYSAARKQTNSKET